MSSFLAALPIIFAHEGGWVNDPADLGGETNYGISMRFIKAAHLQPFELGLKDFSPGCLKLLTREKAAWLYENYFWAPAGRASPATLMNQDSANKLFDAIVNLGRVQAVLCAQRAVGGVMQDGILGPETLTHIDLMEDDFEEAMAEAMKQRYLHILDADPSQDKFRHNWLGRAACTSKHRCPCHPATVAPEA